MYRALVSVPTIDRSAPALPLTLRPSLLSNVLALVPLVFILVANVLTNGSDSRWMLLALIAPIGFVFRWRLRMVLDHDGVTVTRFGTTRLPWTEVRGFEPGSRWRGATWVVTAGGRVWSMAPASPFSGPASAEQIERLEAIRRAHQPA